MRRRPAISPGAYLTLSNAYSIVSSSPWTAFGINQPEGRGPGRGSQGRAAPGASAPGAARQMAVTARPCRSFAAANLRVGEHRTGESSAEPGDIRHAVLRGAAEAVDRPARNDVTEIPRAAVRAALAQRPERVERGSSRRCRAAGPGGDVAQRLRSGQVRLELDVRIGVPPGERPDVVERGREVAAAVRPVREVAEAIEIEVAVLEGLLVAEGHRRGFLG